MSWTSLIPAAASGLASFVQGPLTRDQSKHDAAEAHDWATEDWWTQARWSERMSNTAHQREVEDLRKAGLNPILSASGGSGAGTPSMGAPDVDKAEPGRYGDAIASAMEAKIATEQNNLLKAQTAATSSAKDLSDAQTRKVNKEADILAPKGTIMKKVDEIVQSGAKKIGEMGSKVEKAAKESNWTKGAADGPWNTPTKGLP